MARPGIVWFAMAALLAISSSALASVTETDCNGPSNAPIVHVSTPGHPFSTVLTRDGCWMFVSVASPNPRQAGGIAVFERHGNDKVLLKRMVPIAGGTFGLVMAHDGGLLLAASQDYVVFLDVQRMIAGEAEPILGFLSDGEGAGSLYVNVTPDDRFLFVSDEFQNTISVINLERARANGYDRSAIVGKIPVGDAPIALTFSADGKLLYTTSQNGLKSWNWLARCDPEEEDPVIGSIPRPEGAIIVIDVDRATTHPAESVIARVPAGCNPVRLVALPDGRTLGVTVRKDNVVALFDADKLLVDPSHALTARVPVGTAPVGIAVVRAGDYLVTTNSNRFSRDAGFQTLTVIDPKHAAEGQTAIAATIPAGEFPREFGQSADGRTLFLANARSDTIEIIDIERLTSNPGSPKPR